MPKDSPFHRSANRRIVRRRKSDRNDSARVARIDDAVVPQAGGGEVAVRFPRNLVFQHLPPEFELGFIDRLTGLRSSFALDDIHDTGKLFLAHDRDAMV